MSDYIIQSAFKKAAEKVLDRPISSEELRKIVESYEIATGPTLDRAIKGIAKGTNESESWVRAKTAASDDANRAIEDLKGILDKA